MTPSEIYASLGTLIKRRRNEIGDTQADLAAKIGISRASLANIETGRQKVLVHQLYRLVEALDLKQVSDLLPPLTGKASSGNDHGITLPKGLKPGEKEQILGIVRRAAPPIRQTREKD